MTDYEIKYQNALALAKKCLQDGTISQCAIDYIETIFPELKESEDELTWLKNYISEEAYSLSIDIRDNIDRITLKNLQKSLAWLEKQGQTFTKKDVDDAYLKGVCDAKHELEKQGEKQDEQKLIERKGFTSIPFGAFDSELFEEMFTIPDGCVATIEGNKIHIKREYKTATEAIKEEIVDYLREQNKTKEL